MESDHKGNGQLDDGRPRLTGDDIAPSSDPAACPGAPDPARMTPQQAKNDPKYLDPRHVE
jgi:hypothetical protein